MQLGFTFLIGLVHGFVSIVILTATFSLLARELGAGVVNYWILADTQFCANIDTFSVANQIISATLLYSSVSV